MIWKGVLRHLFLFSNNITKNILVSIMVYVNRDNENNVISAYVPFETATAVDDTLYLSIYNILDDTTTYQTASVSRVVPHYVEFDVSRSLADYREGEYRLNVGLSGSDEVLASNIHMRLVSSMEEYLDTEYTPEYSNISVFEEDNNFLADETGQPLLTEDGEYIMWEEGETTYINQPTSSVTQTQQEWWDANFQENVGSGGGRLGA